MLTHDGLRQYSRGKRIAVRIGYGVSVLLMVVWFVLLVAYAAVFTNVGTTMTGKAKVMGIKGEIVLGLGENEILSVVASDEMDAMYGLGWAHAEYRLFQMEIQRRIGRGKLSEVVGKAGLDVDKFSLTTGFYAAAERGINDLSPEVLAAAQAYVNGVNEFIKSKHKSSLGFVLLGFKPEPIFTVTDVLTYAKLISYSLSGNWRDEIGRFRDHRLRGVSGQRLDQLSPMDPQSTTTVISDAALGTRYDHIPPSTHRNVSLASEVQRLDEYLATAGRTNAAASVSRKRSTSERDSSTSSSSFSSVASQVENDDYTYLSDLLRMVSEDADTGAKGKSVFERAKARFPSFFASKRGFMKASNNWVIHGSRTRSGQPLLANDPHLQLTLPSIWFMASIKTNSYTAIGASFPGICGIPIGHNDHISWGVTNSGMDVQDLFAMDEISYNTYRHNGTAQVYNIRQETIKVKGGKDVSWPVRESLYGPVVNPIYEEDDGDLGYSLSLRWTTLERNDTTIEAFYGLLFAQNWNDFRSSLSKYVAPAQNFIYADKQGNIGYQLPGPIPIRVDGHTGTYPVPGNGSFDWIRKSDFWNESLWVLNPPEGYIVSANNMIATAKYPLNILNDRDWEPRYRAERITQLVNSPYPLTMDDMQAIQQDTVSLFALEFVRGFRFLSGLNKQAKDWVEYLLNWDGNELAGSKAALAFESMWVEVARLTVKETEDPWENPRYWINVLHNRTFPDPSCVSDGYDCGTSLGKALNLGLKVRGVGTINTKKTWGTLHGALLRSSIFGNSSVACLFNRKRPTGGSSWTVNVAEYDLDTMDTITGPSYRQVIDLSDLEQSTYILPGGPQEAITSSLYASGFKHWVQGEYLSMTTKNPYKLGKFVIIPSS
jgi:penicillin amidase